MTFRRGAANPRHGARLPRPKGPFCAICQDGERAGNKVIVGLWGYIHFHMELAICERCIAHYRPRVSADPLTLEEIA